MKRYWYGIILASSMMLMIVLTISLAWNDNSLKVQGANFFESEKNTDDIENFTIISEEAETKQTANITDEKFGNLETASIDSGDSGYVQIGQELDKEVTAKEAVLETEESVLQQTSQQETFNESSTAGKEESEENKIQVNENFSDVLFIGDSRTVGLSAYGNLGEAEFFASSGMSVYKLFDSTVSMKDGTKKKLEEILSEKSFQTIYLMLGINELGYDYSYTVKRYKAAVDKIKEMQPNAVLVLQANLHVSQEKSSQDSICNNKNLNTFNADVKKIAEDNGYYYIDVNEIFDDETGNLDTKYCSDGVHLMGKYYSMWGDWIRGK